MPGKAQTIVVIKKKGGHGGHHGGADPRPVPHGRVAAGCGDGPAKASAPSRAPTVMPPP